MKASRLSKRKKLEGEVLDSHTTSFTSMRSSIESTIQKFIPSFRYRVEVVKMKRKIAVVVTKA